MFHPNYLCNISHCFMLSVIFFFLISNEVLISLHSCLDSTHTNCHAAMRVVFNFLNKEIACPIIFVNQMLRLSNTLCRYFFISFHNTITFLKNITLHIKLKTPPHRVRLRTSFLYILKHFYC
jgi:hypothetical protein